MTDLPDFSRGIAHPGTDGLLPAIAQDHIDGTVLMLAWMDRDAFEETMRTGRAVYYSRSRGKRWRKGDSSGHHQTVVEIRVDCDGDAILLRVEQTGAACHENYRSCFFRRQDESGKWVVTENRLED